MCEGVDMLAEDIRSGLPIVKGKPESNLPLGNDVADQNRPVENSRPCLGRETVST